MGWPLRTFVSLPPPLPPIPYGECPALGLCLGWGCRLQTSAESLLVLVGCLCGDGFVNMVAVGMVYCALWVGVERMEPQPDRRPVPCSVSARLPSLCACAHARSLLRPKTFGTFLFVLLVLLVGWVVGLTGKLIRSPIMIVCNDHVPC